MTTLILCVVLIPLLLLAAYRRGRGQERATINRAEAHKRARLWRL